MRLDNGKNWIIALLEVRDESKLRELAPEDYPEWAGPELVKAFKDGLALDFVKYSDDDPMTHIAYQCLSHENEQNKFRASTISDKAWLPREVGPRGVSSQGPQIACSLWLLV